MDEVFVSLRIYVPKLVSQWWASIGLLFGLAGFILQVSGLFQPPSIFWLIVAVVTVAIAAFQLFHSDRVAAAERTIERSGPALPHWTGLALQGNRDATYLATVGCSQDHEGSATLYGPVSGAGLRTPKRPRGFWTTA